MSKVKVSVTIEESILDGVDRLSKGTSRSEIFEHALSRWLHDRRLRALEEEVAEYYRNRSADEAAEDSEWAEHSARQMRKTWK